MKLAIAVLAVAFLSACAPKVMYRENYSKNYTLGAAAQAPVGNTFLDREGGPEVQYEIWHGIFGGGWQKTDWNKQEGYLREELIYTGKSGSTIHVEYREFRITRGPRIDYEYGQTARLTPSDFLAAPSFYQQLTYDLSDSPTIAFRDVRIDVLKADNEKIEYKVTQDKWGKPAP